MKGKHSGLTLGALLDDDSLGLRLVSGNEQDRDRPIAGAHAIDVPQPSLWVDRDWFVLTAGTSLKGDLERSHELVSDLVEMGVACLGFGLEPVFDRVPEQLVAAAEGHGLPVVAVPPHTPFREVIERTVRASLSEDFRSSQRLVAMQRYLLDALGEDKPREAAIDRVAALVQGDVALLTREGCVDISTAEIPAEGLWQEISGRPSTLIEVEFDDCTWVAIPVTRGDGSVTRWLVASVDAGSTVQLVKSAVQSAVPLLSGIERLESTQRRIDRSIRGDLLRQLIEGESSEAIASQLAGFGFSREGLVTVLVIILASDGSLDPGTDVLFPIEDSFEQMAMPYVVARHDDQVIAAVQGGAEAVNTLAEILDGDDVVAGMGVGISRSFLEGVERSYSEAELAAGRAFLGDGPTVVRFEAIEATRAILSEVPLAEVRLRAEPLFEQLEQQPVALATLISYFENELNVSTTAASLHLHPNSLRYRLSRIESTIGASLRDPSVITAVYLALWAKGHVWASDSDSIG